MSLARRAVVVLAAALGAGAPACVFWDMSDWSDHFGADGGGGSTSAQVASSSSSSGAPTPCPSPDASLIAFDCFDRTVDGSWGNADLGGSWSANGPALLSVGGGVGVLTITEAAAQVTMTLFGDAGRDVDVEVTIADPALATADVYVEIRARALEASPTKEPTAYYAGRAIFSADAGVRGELGYLPLGGSEHTTTPAHLPFPMVPNQKMRLHLVVSGASPTSVQMTLWRPALEKEPGTPTVTLVDDAGPQGAGGIGVSVYLSANAAPMATVQFSDFVAYPVQ